ncbi:MAG: antitoxin family protein [Pirellulales bacterium]|nr:antitoxin family protein [Pirellulales bacterium]
MKQAIDAIFEGGAFRPVQPVRIPDGQHVRITVDEQCEPESLELATTVYSGLAEQEIDEIERIALDRRNFFGPRSGNS